MRILGIDPGNIQSAYCLIDAETLRPLEVGKLENESLRRYLRQELSFDEQDRAAIEMIASYGMPVGREVFDTCRWIGRYEEVLSRKLYIPPTLIYRQQEKLHICHDSRAKDTNIRRALIDRFAQHDLKNGKGTKKDPDWFHGFSGSDSYAAYSVALVMAEVIIPNE